jgi:hypothetical protein
MPIIVDNLLLSPKVHSNAETQLRSGFIDAQIFRQTIGFCKVRLIDSLTFALSKPRSTDLSPTKQTSIVVLGAVIATTPSSQGNIKSRSSSSLPSLRKTAPELELFKYVDHRLAAMAA